MEGTPASVNPEKLYSELLAMEGVKYVHDLHIWLIATGRPALSVHVGVDSEAEQVVKKVQMFLQSRYSIAHATVQVEREGEGIECSNRVYH